MNKQLLIITFLIILAIILFSESPLINKTRATLWKASTYIMPNSCYLEGRSLDCSNVKITLTGIELTLKNTLGIYSWGRKDNQLNNIIATITSCSTTSTINTLAKAQEQKIVFRNCTVGNVGEQYTGNINISYTEGQPLTGITRTTRGTILGRITY
ncbi:MAG: hypothetical protein Q7R56_03320 [Nanoarchaeota archaeon]|nr:hypothetical protein [Nanoarchaeota archaeon]